MKYTEKSSRMTLIFNIMQQVLHSSRIPGRGVVSTGESASVHAEADPPLTMDRMSMT